MKNNESLNDAYILKSVGITEDEYYRVLVDCLLLPKQCISGQTDSECYSLSSSQATVCHVLKQFLSNCRHKGTLHSPHFHGDFCSFLCTRKYSLQFFCHGLPLMFSHWSRIQKLEQDNDLHEQNFVGVYQLFG